MTRIAVTHVSKLPIDAMVVGRFHVQFVTQREISILDLTLHWIEESAITGSAVRTHFCKRIQKEMNRHCVVAFSLLSLVRCIVPSLPWLRGYHYTKLVSPLPSLPGKKCEPFDSLSTTCRNDRWSFQPRTNYGVEEEKNCCQLAKRQSLRLLRKLMKLTEAKLMACISSVGFNGGDFLAATTGHTFSNSGAIPRSFTAEQLNKTINGRLNSICRRHYIG